MGSALSEPDSPQSESVLVPQFQPHAVQRASYSITSSVHWRAALAVPYTAAGDHEQSHSRARRQEDRFATAQSESVANAGTCPTSGPKIRPQIDRTANASVKKSCYLMAVPTRHAMATRFSWHSQVWRHTPPRLRSPQTADTRRAAHFASDPTRLAAWQATRCTRRRAHPKSRVAIASSGGSR